MAEIVTFGELMLRLTPPGRQRFGQASHFEITFGGAEANVAVTLAQLGARAAFVTRLPDHEIAARAVAELRGLGVDTSGIVRGGERMGVYFLEPGASQRAGQVIYDRAHSAIAEALPADFDWPRLLDGANWLHWSGITPALSPAAAAIVSEACMVAKRHGLTVSFDLNYRSKLWTREAAGQALTPLMDHVDVCVTNVEEARTVFGIAVADSTASIDEAVARKLSERFGFKTVALTQRSADSAGATRWSAVLFTEKKAFSSRSYEIEIVDRIGAGDCFTGALIFALRRGDDPQRAVDFAIAASTLKHTVPGDYSLITLAEVEALAAGSGGGRVRR